MSGGAPILNPNGLPTRIGVEPTFLPGPNAQQIATFVQTPGMLNAVAIGGLTKREEIASRIAGDLASTSLGLEEAVAQIHAGQIAAHSVAIADAILFLCSQPPHADRDESPQQVEG